MRGRGKRRLWRRGSALRGWLTAVGLTGLITVYFVPLALGATAADLEARVREIALQLRCPVCQGLSVGDSPSELASEMRALIREQLQQGKTPAQVLDYFTQRYGEWILLAPPQAWFQPGDLGAPVHAVTARRGGGVSRGTSLGAEFGIRSHAVTIARLSVC